MPGIFNRMPPPAAVLVTVTWFCVCLLHMLCQMAENEGVELAGEAGVFHSLLPDNAPSGVGELLPPLTPCQPGNKHSQRGWQGKMGWGGNWGTSGTHIILAETTRLKLVLRPKITQHRQPEAETLRFHTDPQVERSDIRGVSSKELYGSQGQKY